MTEGENSSFSGFYQKTISERIELLSKKTGLTKEETQVLEKGLGILQADLMIENVVGVYELPLAIATNFLIDGKEILIPMVIEEASVVAGASKAAKIISKHGGFETEAGTSFLKGQIQIIPQNLDLTVIKGVIESSRESLIKLGNSLVPNLVKRGGGVVSIGVTAIPESRVGAMASIDVLVNTGEAMGANIVNKICEGLADEVGRLTQARVNLKILSNHLNQRLAVARCQISTSSEDLSLEMAQRIVEAQVFAEESVDRAVTHNKGVLNGIDAVALATGQDWRAIEAGVHAFAAREGYGPVTKWMIEDSWLKGEIKVPLAVGVVGGVTQFHPVVATSLKILGVKTANDLSRIMAAVGLAQNFAALYSLVGEGILISHGKLHRRKTEIDRNDNMVR